MQVFGCKCFPYIRAYNSNKLEPRFIECIFLGYGMNQRGYVCYDKSSGKIMVNGHVVFHEECFPFFDCSSVLDKVEGPLPTSSSNIVSGSVLVVIFPAFQSIYGLFGVDGSDNLITSSH